MQALARADVFVITRARADRRYEGIRARLYKFNPRAPVLTAKVEALYWVNERTKERLPHLDFRVAAFCGLGNPSSFWETLRELGVEPVFERAFPDHHRYSSREVRALIRETRTQGGKALVTTEKDVMNLPDGTVDILADVDLYWLKIATVVQEQNQLMKMIEDVIRR
jgi:tetraacyldisaccharide 4'-kinase